MTPPRKWLSEKFPAPSATLRISAPKWKSASASASGLALPPSLRRSFSATATRNISVPLRSSPPRLKNRSGNSPSPAHRSPRSRGAVQRRTARQLRHAAQAQSRHLRANLRPRPPSSFEHARRVRKHRLVARARHLHSSVERIILPDSTILVDYMLSKMTAVIGQMRVFPERMMRNLESTRGLIYSGQLLQDLVEKGMPRDDAYKAVQETPWLPGNPTAASATASPAMHALRGTWTRKPSRTL